MNESKEITRNLSLNQVDIIKQFLKNILEKSCDNWDGPNGLDLASINDSASIIADIIIKDAYRNNHPYDTGAEMREDE